MLAPNQTDRLHVPEGQQIEPRERRKEVAVWG
uniref:Uncharacterized protein n=1 Tax=Arundo donax TaxID=35708 RepID=A0A0A9CBV2_ARUDO